MQGGWIHPDPFTQLPHFDEEECKKLKQQLNGKTLFQYCMLPKEERKAIALSVFGDNKEGEQKLEE